MLRRLRAAAGSAKTFTCSKCSRVVTEMPCGDRKECSSCRTLMKQLVAHDVAVQALGVDSATLQGFFAAVAAARTGAAMHWSDVREMLLTSLSSYHELSHRKVCEVLERPLQFWTNNGYDENHIKLHCPAVNDPMMGRLYRGQLRSEKEVDYRRLSLDLLSKIMEDTRKRKEPMSLSILGRLSGLCLLLQLLVLAGPSESQLAKGQKAEGHRAGLKLFCFLLSSPAVLFPTFESNSGGF